MLDLSWADPDLLARVSMASENDLEGMISAAFNTSNEELLRVVFSECVRRDLPHFKRWIAEERGSLFAELEAMPSDEEVQEKVAMQRWLLNENVFS